MLSFGVTVLPDPPYPRLVELMQLAESHGFEYGWTYDSTSSGRSRSRCRARRASDPSASSWATASPTPARASRPYWQARTRRCTTSPTAA